MYIDHRYDIPTQPSVIGPRTSHEQTTTIPVTNKETIRDHYSDNQRPSQTISDHHTDHQ